MKSTFEDEYLLSEPLIKWLKTFKNEFKGADFLNLSQLIGSDFLNNVLYLIKYSQKPKNSDSNVKLPSTVADRLHHLRIIFKEVLGFYQNNLKQVVMLPVPNLVKISEALIFENCENDLKLLILLLLGCATQCNLKEKFIKRISELLDSEDQEYIEKYFEQLANNSMTADHTSLDLDDNMLHMHHQITQLSTERNIYFEKYYDCFEKHSTDTFDDVPHKDSIPILIQPVVPVTHGGRWELASARKRFSGSEDRNEEDVLLIRYKTKIKVVNKPEDSPMSPSDKEKLKLADEKIKQNEELGKEILNLKHQLHDLDFHKKKLKELNSENLQLIADKQKLRDQLQASRRKEEDIIERLVDCQTKLDDALSEREMDRQKIAEMMKANSNRNLVGESGDESDPNLADSKTGKNKRIKELEREIESLRTRLMEAQKQDNQSDEKWKFLDLQKEKVDARRQLNEALETNEELRRMNEKLESRLKSLENELKESHDLANITKSANDDQVMQLEIQIKELTKQITLLRRKGGKLSDEQFRELGLEERDLMYESVQELSTEVTKLKAHNKILRQTCDKLKQDVDRVIIIERENERLIEENRKLQQAFASKELNSDQIEELRKQNLQLNIENKRLRRIIDTLRFTLMQVDPYNKLKYHYITSI